MLASLRKREEEVKQQMAGHLRERDKERENHQHLEAGQCIYPAGGLYFEPDLLLPPRPHENDFFFFFSLSLRRYAIICFRARIFALFLYFTPSTYFFLYFSCVFLFSSVAKPCHFDTVLVSVQVPTSYFPSYGSGSSHNFNKILK
jgi:hypothetical protein